jgi:hypothetical protein
MQKEDPMNDGKRPEGLDSQSGEPGGVVQSWIDGSLDTAQAVLRGCVDILDQSRTQLNERVGQTLDWAEGFPRGGFAVARQVNRGIDSIAAQSIAAGDRVGRSVLSALRRAGHSARGLASDASSSIVGNGVRDGQSQRMTAAS